MEIKLPKSIKDLRLYHLQAIGKINLNDVDIQDKVVLLHELTSIPVETVRRISINDINYAIDHYMNLIAKHVKDDPPKEVTIDGKKYARIESVGKMPTGWHIDLRGFGTKDSAVMAAFTYIEAGMEYCEMDEHDNVLNPVTPRAEIFRTHADAGLFIDIAFFFTERAGLYRDAFTEIQNQRRIRSEKEKEKRERRKKTTA